MALPGRFLHNCLRTLHQRSVHYGRPLSQSKPPDKDDNKSRELVSQEKEVIAPVEGEHNVVDLLKKEMTGQLQERLVPRQVDIVVIGGGVVGMSVAYWLKQRHPTGFSVMVVEKDPTYNRASTVLSVGGIRQQFSLPENVQMSLFGAEFLREAKEHLAVGDLDPPDVQFNPQGYLFLAGPEKAHVLHENHQTQESLGAKVQLMDQAALKEKFPWMNVEDIEMGSYGLQNEGWFDPWSLLVGLKTKCAELDTIFVKGEVTGFRSTTNVGPNLNDVVVKRDRLQEVMVKAEDGVLYPVKMAMCVNCAGHQAAHIGKLAGIGTGPDALMVPIPVVPRKRYVYFVHCPDGPGLDTPFLVDRSGAWLRREGLGGNYLMGCSPHQDFEEPATSDLDVDHAWFEEKVWPVLAHRGPCFENLKDNEYSEKTDDNVSVEPTHFREKILPSFVHRIPALHTAKVKNAWAGYYDHNYVDQNLIIGNHPYHHNFFMAVGSSGHGLQHSPAIGRAMMELILDDEYKTIDLSRFSFDRFLTNEIICETGVV